MKYTLYTEIKRVKKVYGGYNNYTQHSLYLGNKEIKAFKNGTNLRTAKKFVIDNYTNDFECTHLGTTKGY